MIACSFMLSDIMMMGFFDDEDRDNVGEDDG